MAEEKLNEIEKKEKVAKKEKTTRKPVSRTRNTVSKTERTKAEKTKKERVKTERTSKVAKTTRATRTRKVGAKSTEKVVEIAEKVVETAKRGKSIFKKPKLKIIPLGGLHEVGKNITVFEYEDEIIIVDCGLSFPEDDMLGVDLVIPDVTYLQRNVDKIKGLIITHGHEDHIGSVPYLLKQINIPVYAPKLAMGLIRNKLEEHKILRSSTLVEVTQGQKVKFGKYFEVEFIRSTHSIPDSVMLAIKTPVGTILHTGDFKIDYTPIDGKIMDLGRIAELG